MARNYSELKTNNFEELDVKNLIEEIVTMGRSEKKELKRTEKSSNYTY